MKLKLLLLLCTATLFCCGQQPKKAWTIVTYIAADNDLNRFAQPNIIQMMQAGSNDDRNILVYLAETKQNQKYGKLLRVDKNALVELACDNNVDSGSREVCLNACRMAFTEFPAEHNALIFWDHGSGCLNMPFADLFKGIAYDEGLDTYLTDRDVLSVLREISQTVFNGKKLDILGFDACLMASIELQTSFAPYVDYYVASEELERGAGWDYAEALGTITGESKPQEVAQMWVTAYDKLYAPQTERYTLSAVDLAIIHHLGLNVDAVARELIKLLVYQQNEDIISLLQASTKPGNVTGFDKPEKPDYIDLDHLYANMHEKIPSVSIQDNKMHSQLNNLTQLLIEGRSLIQQVVVANAMGKQHARAGGISVYWAQEMIHQSYSSLIWTTLHPHWEKLMDTYLQLNTDTF